MLFPALRKPLYITAFVSLASRLNGYRYLMVQILRGSFHSDGQPFSPFVSITTLQILGVKNIPCRVASLIDIFRF